MYVILTLRQVHLKGSLISSKLKNNSSKLSKMYVKGNNNAELRLQKLTFNAAPSL